MPWRICGMMRKSLILRTDPPNKICHHAIRFPLSKTGCAVILLLLPAFISCASVMETQAEPPESSTHAPVAPPANEPTRSAPVYLDSVEFTSAPTGMYIRISGNLPTPCHHLYPPEQNRSNDTLNVALKSWQKRDVICVQVIEPFVYYLKIAPPDEPIPEHVFVNGERVRR